MPPSYTATFGWPRRTRTWATLAAALVSPLLGGGSAVVVDGAASEADLARIAATERAPRSMA